MAPANKKKAPVKKAGKPVSTKTVKASAPPKISVKPKKAPLPAAKASVPAAHPSLPAKSADMAIPPRLQAVIDKSEISDLLYTLARGLDRIDDSILRASFHADATIDLGPGLFQGTSNDYISWITGVLNQVRESHHLIGNVLVTLEGSVALVESYCHAHFRLDKPTGREDVFLGSRFLDRFERRPAGPAGVWKIAHRKQILDWTRTEAASDIFYHQNPDALWSYRTKTDPSYQMAHFPGSQPNNKLPSFLGRRYENKSIKF